MEFNPFDMFGVDRHPFPQRRTQNQRSFPNSQTPQMHDNSWWFRNSLTPQMHGNSSWGWPFEVPAHGSRNDRKPNANANYRRDQQRTYAHPATKNAEPTTSKKGRVFSIPVYDGTESPSVCTKAPRMEQGVAAVKIQSTFRGFCVRNSKPLEKLRIIGKVKSDADEIGKRLATQTHLIRGNERECLILDHQIMSLLLRLDDIQVLILTAFNITRGMRFTMTIMFN